MVRAAIAVLVLAGCHASAVAPVATPAAVRPPTPQPRASLHGTLTDTRGDPLAGAKIVAARDGRTYEAVTDEAGRYELVDMPAGDYDVATYDEKTIELHDSLHLEGRSQHDVVLPPRPRSMTITLTGDCARMRRLWRDQMRFRCYESKVDRAMREVDQSPRQLRYDGRPRGPRPPR